MRRGFIFWFLVLIIILSSASCARGTNPQSDKPVTSPTASPGIPSPTPRTLTKQNALMLEGQLVPIRIVEISPAVSGQVTELLIREGDTVETGQLLARIMKSDSAEAIEVKLADAEAAVEEAKLRLMQAQEALLDIYEEAPFLAAQAQLELANAQVAFEDAESNREFQLGERADSEDIASTEAGLTLAEARVASAEEKFNNVSHLPADNPERAAALVSLEAARNQRDRIFGELAWYTSELAESEIALIEAEFITAQARLTKAQQIWRVISNGPDPDLLALANAELSSANALLRASESRLAAVQAEQDGFKFLAPFGGTVVSMKLQEGGMAIAGNVALVLADLSNWAVEIQNLTDLEALEIQAGQKVTVSPDALPDVTMRGEVESIGYQLPVGEDAISYKCRIILSEFDPRLLWGMTVTVIFE